MIDLRDAVRMSADDIARLTDSELFVLGDVVAEHTGQEVVKVTDRERALEATSASGLDEDYRGDLDPAVDRAVEELPPDDIGPDQVNVALNQVGDDMAKRDTSTTSKILTALISAGLLIARRSTRSTILANRKAGISGGGVKGTTISASFTQPDQAAIAALEKTNTFWIGEFWNDHLSRRISATVSKEALGTGLGRVQVGEIIRGVINGEFPGVEVPGTFRGTTEQYFKGLAASARTQASSFGSLNSMEEAGVAQYVYTAAMDERTCERCALLNGYTFNVRDGIALVETISNADSPEAIKRVGEWRSVREVREIMSSERPDEAAVRAGLAVPPLHPLCRCNLVPA